MDENADGAAVDANTAAIQSPRSSESPRGADNGMTAKLRTKSRSPRARAGATAKGGQTSPRAANAARAGSHQSHGKDVDRPRLSIAQPSATVARTGSSSGGSGGQTHQKEEDWKRMSAGDGVHLNPEERMQRERSAAMHAIRQMIKRHRHLFGEEITTVKQLFHAIDHDRSGTIEREEFDAALTRLGLGLSAEQLEELWCGLDADGDGTVVYAELLAEMRSPQITTPNYMAPRKGGKRSSSSSTKQLSPQQKAGSRSTSMPVSKTQSNELSQQILWPPAGPQPPGGMETLVAQAIVHCAMWTAFHGRELEDTIRSKKASHAPSASLWAFLFHLDQPNRPDVQYYHSRLRFEKAVLVSRQRLLGQPSARVARAGSSEVAAQTTSPGSSRRRQPPRGAAAGRLVSPGGSRSDRLLSPNKGKQQRRTHGPLADTHASAAKHRALDRRRDGSGGAAATRSKGSARQLGSPARRDAVARVMRRCCLRSCAPRLRAVPSHSSRTAPFVLKFSAISTCCRIAWNGRRWSN